MIYFRLSSTNFEESEDSGFKAVTNIDLKNLVVLTECGTVYELIYKCKDYPHLLEKFELAINEDSKAAGDIYLSIGYMKAGWELLSIITIQATTCNESDSCDKAKFVNIDKPTIIGNVTHKSFNERRVS